MNKYHITDNGPAVCTASVRPCPIGGAESHFTSKKAAQEAYEKKMSSLVLPRKRKLELVDELIANGEKYYPKEALVKLSQFIKESPYTPLVVVPAGSALYNTAIPGKEIHDYDFTVFTAPYHSLKKATHSMRGEIDVNYLGVDRLSTITTRSTPFSEAVFARRVGHGLNGLPDNPYSALLASFRVPEIKYFDTVDDVMRSHRQQFEEPVSPENSVDFRNFKHTVRWTIYQKRWGVTEGPFDPRLNDEERELFLKTLASGRVATLFE